MYSLPVGILLALTVVTGWLKSILVGVYSKRFPEGESYLWSFNTISNLATTVMLVIIFASSGGFQTFSWFSLILGLLLGASNVICYYSNLKAVALGPFAYTFVIISLAAIIPTLSGLFFGEKISIIQYVGILLMVACIILSPDSQKNDGSQKKANLRWLILCFIALFTSGACGVIQKVHQSSPTHKLEMPLLLLSGFAISTLFSVLMMGKEIKKGSLSLKEEIKKDRRFLTVPLVTGLAFAFPHTINLLLAGKLPSVVLFPIVNLAPMIMLILSSLILFKEKISLKRWIGIIVGVLSSILVSGIISL